MFKPLLAIILTSTLSGIAVAAEKFSQLDEDRNGAISRAEATTLPELYNNWESTDSNADGVVDRAEFSRFEVISSQSGESAEQETQ